MLAPCLLALALIPTADPKPRLDPDGLPLPAEAVQRFGSQRFLVNNLEAAAFSPDGKTVYTISEEDAFDDRVAHSSPGLIAWEVPTGKKLWQVGLDRRFEQVAADPDGKSVWVIERYKPEGDFDTKWEERVRYSAADGKELARTPVFASNYETIALHPTGLTACPIWRSDEDMGPSTMSIRLTDRDGATSDIRDFRPAKEGRDYGVGWSPKADRLFVVTWVDEFKDACVTALDVTAAKQLWTKPTDAPRGWCVSPNGKSFVIVTQARGIENAPAVARRWDADTGKELAALNVPDLDSIGGFGHEIALAGRIHFHSGGKTVYLLDNEDRTVSLDAATWKTANTKVRLLKHAVFNADGRILVAPSGRHVVIHEAETGRRLSPNPPGFVPTDSHPELRFTPTGERMIRTGGYGDPEVEWSVATGREVGRTEWKEPDRDAPRSVTSADGKKKAVVESNGQGWRLVVTNSGRPNDPPVILTISRKENDDLVSGLQFTPDGKYLFGFSKHNGFYIWDVAKGGDPVQAEFQAWDEEKLSNFGSKLFVCRDSKRVAALEFNGREGRGQFAIGSATWRVGVYELPSGKNVRRFAGEGFAKLVAWSPSGVVVLADRTHYAHPFLGGDRDSEFRFDLIHLDPATEQKRVTRLDGDVRCCAMSPVGDAVAVGSSDGLRLYEASTGKLRHRFREQTRPVQVVAFSPDGRFLAAESVDGPLLLWDVRGDLTKSAKPDAAGWDAAWAALGGDGAEAAFRAVRLFALHPDDGAAELKRRFADRKPPTAEAVAALVRQLDDRDYATRERATKELRELGFAAFPALKRALADNPPEELRARAERLLAATTSPDQRRAERAVEAMQLAGTQAAKNLIAEWARGPADDVLTKAAVGK